MYMVTIPPFWHFCLPLLKSISDGQEHKTASKIGAVSDELGLSDKQRNEIMPSKRKSPITYVYHRLGWAKTHLQYAGLVERPHWGFIRITQRGLDVLKDPPTLIDMKYLQQFESWEEWYRKLRSRDGGTDDGDELDVDGGEDPEETMRRGVKGMRKVLHLELQEEISKISSTGFESLVLDLLNRMKYGDTERTGRSGDGGIDGVIYEDELGLGRIYMQCKQYKNPVQPKDVRDFIGALQTTSAKKGIFITTSTFTSGAEEYVKTLKADTLVVLINGKRLVELMEKNGVGVYKEEDVPINKIDRGYFEDFD